MKIIGDDFEIVKDSLNFTLYLKNKDNKLKLFGYYTKIIPAVKAVYRYRKYKKYPFDYKPIEIVKFIKEYLNYERKHIRLANLVYKPINELIEKEFVWRTSG